MAEKCNAKIVRAQICREAHNIMTLQMELASEKGPVMFAQYNLNHPLALGFTIHGIMKALALDNWDRIRDESLVVRVWFDNDGRAQRLGHIIKDDWFDFREIAQLKV